MARAMVVTVGVGTEVGKALAKSGVDRPTGYSTCAPIWMGRVEDGAGYVFITLSGEHRAGPTR